MFPIIWMARNDNIQLLQTILQFVEVCSDAQSFPVTRLLIYAASCLARRARTAWASTSSTATESSQPMQPSVIDWP